MSDVLCITTFNKKLYDKYAFGFMKSFKLPFDLIIYSEEDMQFLKNIYKNNYKLVNSFNCIPELSDFINKNKKRNIVDVKTGGFKKDGIRFCYKVFCVTHCGLNIDEKYKYLIWLDSDIVFKKEFNKEFIEKNFLKKNSMMSYLGRTKNYSECGFLIFNLKHKNIKDYFKEMKRMYTSGDIYKEKEWHDSYIWDTVRKRFEKKYGILNFNISNISQNDVFLNLPILYDNFYHLKGKRKDKINEYKKFFVR